MNWITVCSNWSSKIDFAVCYQDLNIFQRGKQCGLNAFEIRSISQISKKLGPIEIFTLANPFHFLEKDSGKSIHKISEC